MSVMEYVRFVDKAIDRVHGDELMRIVSAYHARSGGKLTAEDEASIKRLCDAYLNRFHK